MSDRFESVMISCKQRTRERLISLRETRRVGIDPLVFESPCTPAGGPHNRYVTYRALQAAQKQGKACLFLEDDILVNDLLFDRMLDMALVKDVPTTFTCFRESLHPAECWKDFTPRLVKMVNTQERRGFYGTQAFYLPADLVHDIVVNHAHEFISEDGGLLDECDGFDFWIKENVPDIWMAFPNPVEHRQPPKMKAVTRGEAGIQVGHQSLSYHLGFMEGIHNA